MAFFGHINIIVFMLPQNYIFHTVKGGSYYVNSCNDAELTGDFNESCVERGNCLVNVGQDQLESSVLFSHDRSLFPRVRSIRFL